MFKCYITDISQLKLFLRLSNPDYVDVLLNKGTSMFIADSPELFGCLSISTETTAVYEPYEFRMPAKILKNIACEGYMYVDKVEDDIVVSFYTKVNDKIATVRFIAQYIFTDGYKHKLELLSSIGNYGGYFDVANVEKFCKICKSSGGIITFDKGIYGSTLSNRGRLFYKPTDMDNVQRFSISADSLSILLGFNSKILSIENYLCTAKNGLTILATKCNGESNEEYSFMEAAKAKFRCNVDISRVIAFVRAMSLKVQVIELDLNSKVCTFDDSYGFYEIPFTVTDFESSPNAEINNIKLPISVVNELFSGIDMSFFLEQKKNFVKLTKDDIFIYF